QTVPVNNGLNAAALSKGALEAAQEANKVMMVTDGSGRTVPVWSGSVAGAPPAMGGSPSMPQRAPGPSQAVPQQSAPVTPVKSPVKPEQSTDPWANVPQFTMPGGIGQDTYHKGLAEGAAKQMGDLATKYGTQADLANQQIAMNNDALEKLSQATTGPQAMGITEIQNFLQNRAGWDPKGSAMTALNNFMHSPGDPAATQELNKELINSALAGAKKIYGPRITQNEVQLQIKQASPNVDQTTGAIRYLLNLGNQQAQYQINQADALSKYRAAGGDPYAFEGWYAKNFPMTQSVGQAAMQPVKQAPVTTQAPSHGPASFPSQSAIAAEMARRGLK
ncbi:MAG: hypothetical protein KGL35_15620, partial [Bradyrhizobium sp.]|nr:hypothetical protein [Bradyrhizobium sp.]